MAKHRGVDTAFAVGANPVHGFVSLGVFAVSVGEDVEVFERGGKSVLAVGELFGFVLPGGGEAFGNRVPGVEDIDTEVMTGTMAGLESFIYWNRHHFLGDVDDDAGPEGFVTPEEASDFVEFGPKEEGVVGGVEVDKTAALPEIPEEILLDCVRPADAVFEVATVEIVDYDHVLCEVRPPMRPLFGSGFAGWAGGDVDGEFSGALEGGFEERRAGLPVVIVDAVENEDGDGCSRKEGSCQEEKEVAH